MANEARVTVSLSIRKDGMDERRSASFQSDITNGRGPSPAYLTATVAGTTVDLSLLAQPSLCYVANLEAAGGDRVVLGIYDPSISRFQPFMEVRASEAYVFRLPRELLEEYVGTGTGTTAPENTLMVKAPDGACRVFIGAFDD